LGLHKKLIFCAVALWRLHEHRLDSVAGGLLHQKKLVRILSGQAGRRKSEHHLDLPFNGEGPHAVQTRPLHPWPPLASILSNTPALGTCRSWLLANSINDAVWLAIVFSSRCCSDDTLA